MLNCVCVCTRVSPDGHSTREGVRAPEQELGSCESSAVGAMSCTGVLQRSSMCSSGLSHFSRPRSAYQPLCSQSLGLFESLRNTR